MAEKYKKQKIQYSGTQEAESLPETVSPPKKESR